MRGTDGMHGAWRRCVITASVVALLLPGCSTVSKIWNVSAQTERVTLEATPMVNDGFPVAVDVVAVTESDFVKVLSDVEAKTWFQRRDEFLNNRGGVMDVRSFELVPGQRETDIGYGYLDRRTYNGIFVFAQYVNGGNHRARLDKFSEPLVLLGREGIRVEPES